MDPALAYDDRVRQLLYATCAKLLNYPDKRGLAGSQLTAEVAQSLPARSADGKTYTFKIRPGFRFSPPSTEPVTAQTFKDTIERTLNPRMHSPVGALLRRHRRRRAPTWPARRLTSPASPRRGDTLTIRLLAPAPDFPGPDRGAGLLRGPVQHPDRPQRRATDPVRRALLRRVLHARPGRRAARNPNYHGSRPHHFARIELAVGISALARVARDRGRHRRLHGSRRSIAPTPPRAPRDSPPATGPAAPRPSGHAAVLRQPDQLDYLH